MQKAEFCSIFCSSTSASNIETASSCILLLHEEYPPPPYYSTPKTRSPLCATGSPVCARNRKAGETPHVGGWCNILRGLPPGGLVPLRPRLVGDSPPPLLRAHFPRLWVPPCPPATGPPTGKALHAPPVGPACHRAPTGAQSTESLHRAPCDPPNGPPNVPPNRGCRGLTHVSPIFRPRGHPRGWP